MGRKSKARYEELEILSGLTNHYNNGIMKI